MKKIQLTDKKILEDAIVVWNQHGPEVDMQMDVKNLSFKPGSVDEIYAFHVLDHLFPNEIIPTINNWRICLKPGGKLFVIVDDFEYIARAFVGGDISIDLLNQLYTHPTQFTRDNLLSNLKQGGFSDEKTTIWFADVVADCFKRNHTELVLQSTKHE